MSTAPLTNIQTHFASLTQDAILWKASMLWNAAATPDHQAAALESISNTVLSIKSITRQSTYISAIEKELKIKKNTLGKTIELLQKQNAAQKKKKQSQMAIATEDQEQNGIEEITDDGRLPKWITQENVNEWRRNGYFIANKEVHGQPRIGYYTLSHRTTEDGAVYTSAEITNFTVTPVMHVYKGDESRHIIEINNGYVRAVKEIPSSVIPSREEFQKRAVTEGSFAIFGSSLQWLRIASDLLHKFPRCIELEDLGWHPAGFFAFSDHIFVPGLGKIEVDNYGIFSFASKKYLLPQQSEAYLQTLGTGSDPFENDRVLTYKQSKISFQLWTEKVQRVYGEKGLTGIAYSIFTLFRDVIAKVTGTSPHLYLFGPPQSGKSVLAETIYNLFYSNRNFFIAYESTVPAFYTYLTRFTNCPAVVNEVDVNTTDPDRLQAFKGAFDLEGREKMNMGQKGNKRSTTIQRINSSLILVGQHIITTDDNALLTRSIIEDFLPNDQRSEKDVRAFDELKQLGKEGISSLLTELLQLRPTFEKHFRELYLEQLGEWIKQTSQQGKPLVQRIMNNYAILSTCYKILTNTYKLQTTAEQFTAYCLQRASQWSSFVSSSDTLSEFWRFVDYLFEGKLVVDGWDLQVETVYELETRDGKKHVWDKGEKILFIRLNNVHKVYQAEHRKRYSKDGISIDNLLHYFKSKKYYAGPVKERQFKRFVDDIVQDKVGMYDEPGKPYRSLKTQTTITSCHAFMYHDICRQIEGFNLVRTEETVPRAGVDFSKHVHNSNDATAASQPELSENWKQVSDDTF